MKLQVLQDNLGNQTGVYVPIEDWNLIKNNYPDIEKKITIQILKLSNKNFYNGKKI